MHDEEFRRLAVNCGAVATLPFNQSQWSKGGPIYYWRPFFYTRFLSSQGWHRFGGNYCGELSAEWLFLAYKNKLGGFDAELNKNMIRRRVERSKQKSGAIRRMRNHFRQAGAPQSWRQGTTPDTLAIVATTRSKLFWVGFDGPVNDDKPAIGHVIAVDNRKTPRVFDPNFGMVEFQTSQQAQGFISTLLGEYRLLLADNRQFAGRCDIFGFG